MAETFDGQTFWGEDGEPIRRFKEGDYLQLNAPQDDYVYTEQDNSDGPTNGNQIVMGDVLMRDILQVLVWDWDGNQFVYHLQNNEGWDVWVPEIDLRRWHG
jgi:hypothetical protein